MNISDFLVNTCVKQSKFNIKVDLNGVDQDSVYIFNSFSGSFISIRKAVSDYFSLLNYKEIDVNTIDKEYMDYLVSLLEGNFLLDKHIDEIQLLKYLYNKGRFVSNYLNITIIPTLDCNLNCPYCYQHKEDRSVMSQVIQDKIIDFIKSKISNKISSIHVAWYGGEPLLCVNIIDNLSVKIMQLAQEAKINYSSNMVTNGTLITNNICDKLKEYKVNSLQITLDGIPEIHDRKRVKKNGENTFWKILDNIKLVSEKIPVSLRVNIDKDSKDSIISILDILEKYNINKEMVFPYLGLIRSTTSACSRISSNCISEKSFSIVNAKFVNELSRRGFKSRFYPKPSYSVCGAVSENTFSIDPTGNIYKCWETIAIKEEAIGNLMDNRINVNQQNILLSWMNYDPFSYKKCAKCKIFPVCFCGCPSSRINHLNNKIIENERCSCYIYKKYFNEVMKITLEDTMKRQH